MDAIFFAGFPGPDECRDILKIHIEKPRELCPGRDSSKYDLDEIANMRYMDGNTAYPLTGAEWESAILDAMYESYAEAREVTTDDIIRCVKLVKPVSYVMRESMEKLYEFGMSRCLAVSSMQLDEPCTIISSSAIGQHTSKIVTTGVEGKAVDTSLMGEEIIG